MIPTQKANKHERLFWFNTPSFSLLCVQFLLVGSIFWTEILFAEYFDSTNILEIVLFSITSFFCAVNVLFFVPSALQRYSIISNIEMMKDTAAMEKVVATQKSDTRKLFAKSYRLFKSYLKDYHPTESHTRQPKIAPTMDQLIKDSFAIIGDKDKFDLKQLPRFVHLCGNKLEKDELTYLAKEASSDLQDITLNEMRNAIEKLSDDVAMEPYGTIREALLMFMERNGDYMKLKELREFIAGHKILEESDVNRILHEVKYMSWNENEVDIDNVAAQIRNNIEGMAR